ncbi:DegT/DnrJ/EryC1/StrS family aminotransferase [Sphingomonas sp. DG1-23]|uniref:DegT/DnrJ/EryC1/StrS family aminotransferase n=1 Tax=Sphingomonas sp. DG1-23 TaxID=3068316 RepID=UPI00273E8E6B|nr:DegT/DnrJ/EryC1/StrS family aminotransferase [Sphingomonas sp. DG1-23]MDP5278684.1 DegT/DnrJ/EryC1/StrS family aminotransferase [Sphingomonas sp. DG1-23]
MQTNALGVPAWPIHGPEEAEAVQRVLASRTWWRGSGSECDLFEAEFAKFLGLRHARLTSSGSGALEIALQLGDISPGDEVLVPACTFIATASAVLRMGACPIPVDVEAETLCIDPEDLERKCTPRARAVIPVHMAGQGCEMDAIMAIARRHGLFVIEDAAHAHGARWRGSPLGGFGDVAIFSFQNGKLMTAGEGGAVVTNRDDLAERSFALHSCGRPRGDTDYRHLEIAGNWRAPELVAAVLRAQLARLPGQLALREKRAPVFDGLLARNPRLRPLKSKPDTTLHSHYMAMAWVDADEPGCIDTADLSMQLRRQGIPAFKCFPPVHHTRMFEPAQLRFAALRSDFKFPDYRSLTTPVSEAAGKRVLWFHHSVLLADEAVLEKLATEVSRSLGNFVPTKNKEMVHV